MVIITAREFESTCNYFLIITVTIAKPRVLIQSRREKRNNFFLIGNAKSWERMRWERTGHTQETDREDYRKGIMEDDSRRGSRGQVMEVCSASFKGLTCTRFEKIKSWKAWSETQGRKPFDTDVEVTQGYRSICMKTSHQRPMAWSKNGTQKQLLVSWLLWSTHWWLGTAFYTRPLRLKLCPFHHLRFPSFWGSVPGTTNFVQSESVPHLLLFLDCQTLGILAFPYETGRDTHRGFRWSQDPFYAFLISSSRRNSINVGSFQIPLFPTFYLLYTIQNTQAS